MSRSRVSPDAGQRVEDDLAAREVPVVPAFERGERGEVFGLEIGPDVDGESVISIPLPSVGSMSPAG